MFITQSRSNYQKTVFKNFAMPISRLLLYLIALAFSFSSCKTIAYYDDGSFVKTAELKAKTLVLISHSDEDFKEYRAKVDDIMVMAETIYAMQKARELNYLTVKQWDIMMKGTGVGSKSILPEFFNMWKKKEIGRAHV